MKEIKPKELLIEIVQELVDKLGPHEAEAMAYYLLDDWLKITRSDIIVDNIFVLSDAQLTEYKIILERLNRHEPIQYILGHTTFYGRQYVVDTNVLIPRQETEELVHLIVEGYKEKSIRILDVGVGSGCISCSLALEIQGAEVFGVDISEEAISVAKLNSNALKAGVDFRKLDALKEDFPFSELDIIVSNPPYVMELEKKDMSPNVLLHEPDLALFVDDRDPLIFYRKILENGKLVLKNGGEIYFEINEQLGNDMRALCRSLGFSDVKVIEDINGKDRFVSCTWYGD